MGDFEKAFKKVIGHEGGYVNDPKDPGGETKYGISKRAYPHLGIASLDLETAKNIYFNDYWQKVKGCFLEHSIALNMFDAAVNHGVNRAIKLAQGAVGVDTDGILGEKTLTALIKADPVRFNALFNAERLAFYTTLPTFASFGRGWVRRVAENMKEGA